MRRVSQQVLDGSLDHQALRSLLRVFGLVQRLMEPYFAAHGISGAQWGVLRNLHRAEAEGLRGLRPSELVVRLLVRPPTITGVVDRLVRAGLVRRTAAVDDQRAKQVSLTSAGRELVRRMLRAHPGKIQEVMCGLAQAEQFQLMK